MNWHIKYCHTSTWGFVHYFFLLLEIFIYIEREQRHDISLLIFALNFNVKLEVNFHVTWEYTIASVSISTVQLCYGETQITNRMKAVKAAKNFALFFYAWKKTNFFLVSCMLSNPFHSIQNQQKIIFNFMNLLSNAKSYIICL